MNALTSLPSSRGRRFGLAVVGVLVVAGLLLAANVIRARLQAPSMSVQVERVVAAAARPTGKPLYRFYGPVLSADGQVVAFWSIAGDIVNGDTNGTDDVFVKDLKSGAVERVSVGPNGAQANGPSQNAALSADGRFVAFESRASNLVTGDTNNSVDIFVKDRQTGAIERVSVAANGAQANGGNYRPALSSDGRYVAFWSEAGTLVPDDNNATYDNGGYDIFVKDRQNGAIERVSVAADGSEGVADCVTPALSADARFVVFGSYASNLAPADGNSVPDVMVKDRQNGKVELVSVAADGSQGDGSSFWNPSVSADGRFVAFWSEATNLVPGDTNDANDVFVKDRQTGAVERVSVAADGGQANRDSYNPILSADGRFVAFWSEATNLVPGDTNNAADVFVKDRQTGALRRVSVGRDGSQGNGASYNPGLSADGRLVAYWSEASNLVPNDTNGKSDVFIVDLTSLFDR